MKKILFLILLIVPSLCWGQQAIVKIYPAVDSAQVDAWGFLLSATSNADSIVHIPVEDTTGNIGDGYGLIFDETDGALEWEEFWATPVTDPTDNYILKIDTDPDPDTFYWAADDTVSAYREAIADTTSAHWDEWLHTSGGTMTGALDMGDGAVYNAERVEADSICIGGTLANQVLSVVGNIATGDTATGDVDIYHYFSTNNSWTTEYLMWDDGNARFDLSSKLYVEGYIMADGHILRLNVIGSNNDCVIEFGKPSPAEEETLRWNKTDNRFEFSSDLYVNGTVSSSNLLTKSFTIQAIDSDHDIKLWKTPVAITIDSIFGQCDGGTNVIGALDEYDWDNTDLVAVVNADWTFTTTYQAVGSFTNAGIAAKNHLKWHTTSVSGTVNFFDLTIWYHED